MHMLNTVSTIILLEVQFGFIDPNSFSRTLKAFLKDFFFLFWFFFFFFEANSDPALLFLFSTISVHFLMRLFSWGCFLIVDIENYTPAS